jgi:hypothetical protein
MVIHHRLNLFAELAGPILEALGLLAPQTPPADGRIVIPDISENDPSWPRVAVLLDQYHGAWTSHPSNTYLVARLGSTGDPPRRHIARQIWR